MIEIKKLLNSISVKEAINHKEIKVSGIAYHSEKVTEGNLFVCIKGYKTDGHKYLSRAVKNGAVAAIVEEYQDEIDIPQYIVMDSRQALAKLGAEFYEYPSKDLKMIGITATNGKTTTTFMTNAILENHGYKTGLIGTVSIKIDNNKIPSELTTPESLDLHGFLKQMKDCGVSHVTMEVSSAALEMHRVDGVNYDIVAFNNISREHIDSHGSFEKYYEAKSKLITEASEKSYAIINLDCPYSAELVNKTKANTITYGLERGDGHIQCKNLDLSTGRGRFTISIQKSFFIGDIIIPEMEFDIQLSVPGLHSVYNSIVAVIVGLLCGVTVDTIQDTLKNFSGVERRFEFIFEDDIKIIDDHFANSGNINVTLETLKFMDYKNLHLVYAIRGERGPIVNRENSETIVSWAPKLGLKEIIATKSKSHVTEKDRVTDEELKVFQEVMERANIKVNLYDELPDAISHALSRVSSDDLILLAGCQGMDYGAEIALNQLHLIKPDFPKDKLFYPLKNRISGIS